MLHVAMAHNQHHEHLIKETEEMLSPLLQKSPQGVYVYLDDEHKFCNEHFSKMLGYTSVEEWVKNESPLGDVVEADQERVVKAYMDASEHGKASILTVSLQTKQSKKITAEIIMTPLTYQNEVFVLHFITPKK